MYLHGAIGRDWGYAGYNYFFSVPFNMKPYVSLWVARFYRYKVDVGICVKFYRHYIDGHFEVDVVQ